MDQIKRYFACFTAAAALMSSAFSCSSKSSSDTENTTADTSGNEQIEETTEEPVNVMEITWLSDYDLNPMQGKTRSSALALFEDVYGGKINYVHTALENKYEMLDYMISAGEEVDMFPYEIGDVPYGIKNNRFEALDPYFETLEMDSSLWKGMEGVIDTFKLNGQHYVIPYAINDPVILTYSRKLMEENELGDPYKLYCEGKWDWDALMEMMEKFKSGASSRRGIGGWVGKALMQSTGHTVVKYENGKFVNNISDPMIEKAELFMSEIAQKGLYNNSEWFGNFPDDKTTLFYAMGDWALGASNAANPELDLMVVPFPKAPGADKYYMSCDYNARMLVKNSQKGEGVATYIKCERLAATEPKYFEAAKKNAVTEDKTATGIVRSFVTEEQYDAVQSFKDPAVITPVFDLGYGMGDAMYGSGNYTYDTQGVLDKLEAALIEGNENVESWEALRDAVTGTISAEVEKFNG